MSSNVRRLGLSQVYFSRGNTPALNLVIAIRIVWNAPITGKAAVRVPE